MSKTSKQIGELDEVKQNDAMTSNAKQSVVAAAASDAILDRPANPTEVGTSDSSKPSDQQPRANTMAALNDDCLMELFEWLDIRDLYELAYVCKRFRPIAVTVFKSKFRNKPLGGRHFSCNSMLTTHEMSLFIDFVRIFDPPSILIDSRFAFNTTLRRMAIYSTDLRELDISCYELDVQTQVAIQPILSKLRKLEILATNILDSHTIVDWQLEDLRIYPTERLALVMSSIRTPWLTKVVFMICEASPWDGSVVLEFLARNVQVTKLEFESCYFSWAQWCALAECAPNVQELKMSCVECTDTDIDNQVAATFQCLTAFEIEHFPEDERIIESLCNAPLKRLKLQYCPNEDFLVRIVRSTSTLQELYIEMGPLTMRCIERILGSGKAITTFDVGQLRDFGFSVELEPIVLDRISEIVAGRPELQLNVRVWGRNAEVREKLICLHFERIFRFVEFTDFASFHVIQVPEHVWRPHTKWLSIE